MSIARHLERHRLHRIGWLRAAVLGANDGVVSTASLIVGIAAAASGPSQIILTGIAGVVAGAMSMAAGEYVSVSSQADAERADLAREADELATDPGGELRELTKIYEQRGLAPALAVLVATQLMATNALAAHARDELGLSDAAAAKPVQAALASAFAFALGGGLPLLAAACSPPPSIALAVAAVTLIGLTALGAIGALAGGAAPLPATVRVVFWGALAMAVTAGIGRLVGAVL
jgi:VIT1/CCC1 family predicted Fe2+/Mn2+ transporter